MGIVAQLNQTTILTPREYERSKTAQQRAEDVIYTLNHTFTCLTLTDLFIVPVLRGFGLNIGHGHGEKPNERMERVWVDTLSSAPKPPELPTGGGPMRMNNFCGEDNCVDPQHKKGLFSGLPKDTPLPAMPKPDGHYITQKITVKLPLWQRLKGEVKHAFSHLSWKGAGNWFAGEAIGDVGAAAVTIPIQRFFPGIMDGIRHVSEPVVGKLFRHSAKRDAKKWGERHQLAPDSNEVVNRAQELYQYEMRHLPQMLVWTVSSVLLHYGVMRKLEPAITIGEFSRQKAAGAVITAGLIFGVRALAPDKAHKWDRKMGEHVVVPLTKKAGKLFGLKELDVDDYHARRTETNLPKNWIDKIKEPTAPSSLRA